MPDRVEHYGGKVRFTGFEPPTGRSRLAITHHNDGRVTWTGSVVYEGAERTALAPGLSVEEVVIETEDGRRGTSRVSNRESRTDSAGREDNVEIHFTGEGQFDRVITGTGEVTVPALGGRPTPLDELPPLPQTDSPNEAIQAAFAERDRQTHQVAAAAAEMSGNPPLPPLTVMEDDEADQLSRAAEVVARTDSRSIRLAAVDVVERIAEEIRDTAEDQWHASMASSVIGFMGVLREYVDGEAPAAVGEGLVSALQELGKALAAMSGYEKWARLGHALLAVVHEFRSSSSEAEPDSSP